MVLCVISGGSPAGAEGAAVEGAPLHHDFVVAVEPTERRLSVEDTVTLSGRLATTVDPLYFLLHAGLDVESRTAGVQVHREEARPGASLFGPGAEAAELPGGVELELYSVALPVGTTRFTLAYAGVIDHPPSAGETRGTISDEGVFLAASTVWYPWFGQDLVTVRLDVKLPPGWDAVSQGGRELHEQGERGTRVRWVADAPQDDVYLVAGRYAEAARPAGPVNVQVYLREPDPALAGRYLDVGAQYLAMYARLLGPYPYPKFALVENFWETGYGMPSFSLLGPRVIRFPFILHSSYPHEILHNWWGNGVYVDWERGNWCEGLTAYLADHLIQEGQGAGAAYRQTTLQKYTDYVSRGRDFPLAEFRARHSAATEAVGYGKALLFYHMLRRQLGDEAFLEGLRRFYREYRFRVASFDDLRRCLEAASGADLARDFDEWVERTGAPRLGVAEVAARGHGKGWTVELKLLQTQPEEPYRLRVPVAVTLAGREDAFQSVVEMERRAVRAALEVPGRPLRVDVDPEFDVFRRLDPAEIPPALSGIFGAEWVLAVVPSRATDALRDGYRVLAEGWARSADGRWDVVTDDQLESLPSDRAVWLFGWENRFREQLADALEPYGATVGEEGVRFGGTPVDRPGHSVVVVARQPDRPDFPIAWLAADQPSPLPGLGRKLPHYHKYSYLAFSGDEPDNLLKGRWPVVGSPLTVFLPASRGADPVGTVPMGRLAARRPLAMLPPVSSEERERKPGE